jgi:cytochrome P450
VILGSEKKLCKLISERLFDKRGAIYSSRPENHIGNDLICPGQTHILLVPYGAGWRVLRKTVQALLNVKAVDSMVPIQNAEATQTMYQLLRDPDGYYDHIRRYSTAVILSSVFGQRGAEFNSPKVRALYHAQDQFTSILEPGATPPVDAFPLLRYIPRFFASWKAKAKAIRAEQRSLYFALMEETKTRVAKGIVTGSFMERVLKDQPKNELDDEHVAYLGGTLVSFEPNPVDGF